MFSSERELLENLEKDDILKILKNKPHLFFFFPQRWKDDKDIVVEAIYHSPYNYKYISNELQNERTIILQTIALNGYFFYMIPQRFRDDKEICYLAINNYSFNTRYLSERLKYDEDIFFLLVMKNSWTINYMSCSLRNNTEIVNKALNMNRNILGYLNTTLKYEINFIVNVLINKHNFLLTDFPISIRNNVEIIKYAVKKNYINFIHVPKKDKNFLYDLYLLNPKIKYFLENTPYQYVLDKYNYLELLQIKNNEKKENFFHSRDVAYYILEFLF